MLSRYRADPYRAIFAAIDVQSTFNSMRDIAGVTTFLSIILDSIDASWWLYDGFRMRVPCTSGMTVHGVLFLPMSHAGIKDSRNTSVTIMKQSRNASVYA